MGEKQEEEGWFIYSFVARGTIVLAEFTEYTGNFPAIAAQCLQRLPASNNRYTYACDHHTFNFLLHDGYVYCVVAKESVPKHISMALLERVKADFKKRYGGGKADTAIAKSLNKEFGSVIKEHMQYTIEHADEIEKLLKVKAQISEIKSIMFENIEKAIDRGEKLNELAEKTTDLHSQRNYSVRILDRLESNQNVSRIPVHSRDIQQMGDMTLSDSPLDEAQDFRKQGTKIRKKMWFHNMKIKLVILGILLLLVLIIWVSICQGFNCTKQEGRNANTEP